MKAIELKSYPNCEKDLDQLLKEGRLVQYSQTDRLSDKVLLMGREQYFSTQDEFTYFKDWFAEDFKQASQNTIENIKNQKLLSEHRPVIRRADNNNQKPVNFWIFGEKGLH